jgi:hypothetical protein
VLLGSCLFAVAERGSLFAGLAGVSIIFSLSVTMQLSWVLRTFAEMENSV